MGYLFNAFVYQPIYNLLVFIYNIIPFHDFGVAIILVTVFIKLILIPLSKKQIESQRKMQELQPKIKELQQKYKNDKEKQSRAVMELYKTHKTNPFSGCLPLIFQLVFLIAIYRVLFNISGAGLKVTQSELYPFISNPGQINQYFLGLIDLSKTLDLKSLTFSSVPHLLLIFLAAASQYFQTKMLMGKQAATNNNDNKSKEGDIAQIMSQQMLYLGPLLTLFIGVRFPAGLALYWLVSTVFMIAQQVYLEKKEIPAKIN
jgi:YidC/Oxa1 family membrane protein insertase